LLRIRTARNAAKASKIKKISQNQGLDLLGNVERVMKDVKPKGGLNAEIQSRIGHQLRAMYDDVVRQGVPDRFADMIRKLDGAEAQAQLASDAQIGGGTAKTEGGE
jgi:Anti-sigma factor NepR